MADEPGTEDGCNLESTRVHRPADIMLTPCARCGQPRSPGSIYCAHCGAIAAAPRGDLSTGAVWGDVTIGVVLAMGSNIIPFIGPFLSLAAYFGVKDRYPHLARGMGYGLITTILIYLGLLAICLRGIGG